MVFEEEIKRMIRREKEGCWAKKKEIFGRKPNMNDILLNDVDNMLLIRYNTLRVYVGGVQRWKE